MPDWASMRPDLLEAVQLFDGRVVHLMGKPFQAGGSAGWCAKAREVLNAQSEEFSHPEYGPVEMVSLEGLKLFIKWSREHGVEDARVKLREHMARTKAVEPS